MLYRYKKSIIIISLLLVFFIVATFLNVLFHKSVGIENSADEISALAKAIDLKDINNIDYDFINKNLIALDDYIDKEIDKKDIDMKKKTNVYIAAEKIYENMLIAIRYVLNEKLDDEDFMILEKDMEEFNKNIDFATEEISNTIKSSIEADYYINKYKYEEKQNKCHEIINTYVGFLNIK